LLQFWFSQVNKNFSDYASRRPDFIRKVEENLNAYYGRAFERAATEFLISKLNITDAHHQWGNIPMKGKGKQTYEIDFIGTGPQKEVFVFEFKWQDLTYSDARSVLEQLKSKAQYVQKLPPNVRFGILAKKLKEKERIREAQYSAYDLDDM